MRHHHGLIRTTIALLCAISTSTTTIAEEALPVVQPKRIKVYAAAAQAAVDAGLLPPALTVDLPAEPLRDFEPAPMSLAEAARANDYAAFDAAYQRSGDAAYAELHALWTFSVTDPIGGFYGAPMHDRLARAYPRYAAYIEEFRIVDRNGNVFYPSAETRGFLTTEAIAGVLPQRSAVRTSELAPKRESVTVTRKTTPTPAPAPKAAETTAVPVTTVVVPAQPAAPVVQQAARKPETENRKPSSRGLFLIIIGLLGIGALTMMLRMPTEDVPPAEQPEPPLKFTKAGGERPAEPRATGSHG